MGIGNASIVALYKPIADNDYETLGGILTSSKKMYLRSGSVYVLIVLIIALAYPALIKGQADYYYTFLMVLCIGSVNAIDYFILGKYKVFLIAEQKYYILNIFRIIATILLIVGSVVLLYGGASLLLVKAVAVFTHLLEALLVYLYIKRKYGYLNYNSKTEYKIEQRWNAMVHQLCATVVYNTDLVVLTIFLPGRELSEISVYTVYAMVLSMVSNLTGTLTTGINAGFGDMFARKENETVINIFNVYEYIFFVALFCLYSCCGVLITSFVNCYTLNVTDVNYIRYGVGLLFTLNGLTAQIKEVSGVIINGAGRYKETQRYAVEEAVVNIVVSLILVRFYGIIGVLIGTLVSHIIMDFRFIVYAGKNLVYGTLKLTVRRLFRNFIISFVAIAVGVSIVPLATGWIMWIKQAICVAFLGIVLFVGVNILCENKSVIEILKQKKSKNELGVEKLHD
jgi:O-antigen/teichoic acid export membrane protein